MLAARETKMLSAERMERMIDAPTNDEAAKILEECGYGDLSGLSAKEAGAALEAHIAALFDEVEGMVPEAQLVQLFRLKYDYHNAKALIKARAMGVECDAILSQRGTVAPQKLLTAFLEEDYRDIPPILAQAMVSAAAILARTTNPQAADFELDRAYFAQMLALSDGLSDGGFARGYVQLQIDSANLRAAVRTRRMAKDADFLKTALIPGGTIGTDRVLAAFDSAEALTALYGNTWLGNAAAAGAAAMSGGAVLGAPLIHDFAVISLSDLLTPWEKIEKRLLAAAEADFAICLYNPSSRKRKDYLRRACDLLLRFRSPETVCGTVRNIGRPGEAAQVCTLAQLRELETDMFTTVFVGNSQTRALGGHMVTPRGYRL